MLQLAVIANVDEYLKNDKRTDYPGSLFAAYATVVVADWPSLGKGQK